MRAAETKTEQMLSWSGEFGREYTDRNARSPNELERIYYDRFGQTRTEINLDFLDDLDRSMRILEVGSNIGNQLIFLQTIGYENLWGVELQWYAVEQARRRTENMNIVQGSAFDLPFKDNYFDLVFTSGLLIHISPDDLPKALSEIYRCSSKFIWGFEYYDTDFQAINYRGHDELMWKGDYASIYQDHFGDLEVLKQETYKYADSDNVDACFLMQKK